jgi:hypothetical protein
MSRSRSLPRLGVFHCTATGAATLGLLFPLLRATSAMGDPRSFQGMLVFLTQQALRTPEHIGLPLGQAILLGGLIGVLVALRDNALKFLSRPSRGHGRRGPPSSAPADFGDLP